MCHCQECQLSGRDSPAAGEVRQQSGRSRGAEDTATRCGETTLRQTPLQNVAPVCTVYVHLMCY